MYHKTSEKKSKNFTKCVKEGNIIISESEKETIEIAKEYAKTLKSGDVLRLDGDLGAGKTAFVKGIALGLNIDSEVVSPTYAYLNDYEGKLFHFDMYRIPDEEYAENLGLFEYFYGNGICVVEWAERVENHLPEKVKKIEIKNLGGNNREIKL